MSQLNVNIKQEENSFPKCEKKIAKKYYKFSPLCQKYIKNNSNLNPSKLNTNSNQYNKSKFDIENQKNQQQCEVCKNWFRDVYVKKLHMYKYHNIYPNQCAACDSSYKSLRELKSHIEDQHLGLQKKSKLRNQLLEQQKQNKISKRAPKRSYIRRWKCYNQTVQNFLNQDYQTQNLDNTAKYNQKAQNLEQIKNNLYALKEESESNKNQDTCSDTRDKTQSQGCEKFISKQTIKCIQKIDPYQDMKNKIISLQCEFQSQKNPKINMDNKKQLSMFSQSYQENEYNFTTSIQIQ
ncbi:hypothetical protein PPERSA_01599 [Pseudocohnilembus persalinus]|uniref:C2H2-type domain-containing protein n=1 Tax=Pseudocohnilembus persalinus TaxID=266149 RepID=A0A0V0QHI0_PSEPJ|nr:hypothetical protein PPERSA_01599 [Pseudocohnilembus persalinus]|eukprot:KRX01729.1 hypothetical protein PPERSA_01599 [Pseudocohnilembus persalinus]